MNEKHNLIVDKSYRFALEAIELFRYLTEQQKEYVLSKQFLRAATSIGANAEEAPAAQSKKGFVSKMSISSKEARESKHWLRLMRDSGYISSTHMLLSEIDDIINILTKIVKTGSQNAQ